RAVANPRDELRLGVLLRVGGEEVPLVLEEDARAGPEELGREVDAGVGAVRWDSTRRRRWLPMLVRRHADPNRDTARAREEGRLTKICRKRRESLFVAPMRWAPMGVSYNYEYIYAESWKMMPRVYRRPDRNLLTPCRMLTR